MNLLLGKYIEAEVRMDRRPRTDKISVDEQIKVEVKVRNDY